MESTPKQKMLAGELYHPNDPEIQADAHDAKAWMVRYNASLALSPAERRTLLRERFAAVGEGAVIRPPFHCDYGLHITLEDHVFLNFGCVILDCAPVFIGARTQIGPGVQILTADHPRDAPSREAGLEFARAIRIGRNVWIGGGALILPGVTVGDHAIIGAGSVVTRDVAAGDTVVGNPARPLPRREQA
ncbi:Maltose O-acetyltransferase [Methylobacterium adhaesivum]|uniref:Sugar O-acetyltransferase n=1 Tax=Methylobacterium adhaesivum TaxID=333297 RepID=A0ABT8BET3_9HYPH|nr:sugar O-acetyltransferase [Methylobacterium adhaesivum]MDN3590339.1 sugar O-acetyltransferase [Methylobacterium adhaesivum]GJD30729.1 Maltose O-acetyltransferase [Methylobacterium adhaesivum]